jgi:DNA-binding NarL/FixJ family response regulator
MSKRAARVVIADRQQVFRQGLRCAFREVGSLALAGEAGDVEELDLVLQSAECEVVLADLSLGNGARQSVVVRVRRAVPDVGIVVVAEEARSEGLREALMLGAAGFLRRDALIDEFVTAVEKVSDGNHYIQAELVRHLIGGSNGPPKPDAVAPSPRQIGILQAVATGRSNRQIASGLGISETTVKADLRVLFAELGAASRAEAIAIAMRSGLID